MFWFWQPVGKVIEVVSYVYVYIVRSKIMKFLAICGSGLGSSFMVQMNIEKELKSLGVNGVEVEHSDISSASTGMADVFLWQKM